MDQNSLQLIINNDKALQDLDRYFKDSGELHLICDKIGRERDPENREQLINKMKWKNKAFAESIVKLASMLTTLKYNPQSPVAQWLTTGGGARRRKLLIISDLDYVIFLQQFFMTNLSDDATSVSFFMTTYFA